MSQQSLIWPLTIIVLALATILSIVANPDAPRAAPLQQSDCVQGNPAYPACLQQNNTLNNPSYPDPTNTRTPTLTYTPNPTEDQNQNDDDMTPTSTRTPVIDDDNDNGTITPTATRTSTATVTPVRNDNQPPVIATPTSTVSAVGDVLNCVPEVLVLIEGQGPPLTPLMLFFNGRPVGGATSDPRGFYKLRLVTGRERPGDYPVEVQVRHTREVIDERICRVPGSMSPTPTEVFLN